MGGAPAKNNNAQGHGLYSSQPERRIRVAHDAELGQMATWAEDLASGALWIAEALAGQVELPIEANKLIGLYASVSQELNQVAAELEGESGIKPAALGQLPDDRYETLMLKQAKALELVLNQCIAAWQHIKDHEDINHDGLFIRWLDEDEVEHTDVNPVLNYLAGHMRIAKRIMREMAANRAWKVRGVEREDDLMARLLKAIDE